MDERINLVDELDLLLFYHKDAYFVMLDLPFRLVHPVLDVLSPRANHRPVEAVFALHVVVQDLWLEDHNHPGAGFVEGEEVLGLLQLPVARLLETVELGQERVKIVVIVRHCW